MKFRTVVENWDKEFVRSLIPEVQNSVMLIDGVYEISDDTEVYEFDGEAYDVIATQKFAETVKLIVDNGGDPHIGSAYQCPVCFLFSKSPVREIEKYQGSDFNYGSCNLLPKTEGRILILAEDD